MADLLARAQKRREAASPGGGDGSTAYVPIFCPHCGEHINEVDEQDTPENREADLGSRYRCGWCGIETFDWNHVLICRRTHKARARLAESQRVAEDAAVFRRTSNRLQAMLDDLGD